MSNGAKAIIPVVGIPEALSLRSQQSDVLLASERDGVRISTELSGGVEFDLGNSPREFQREIVEGRTIVMTTTNGTRALQACAHAKAVLVASFLNLRAVADCLSQSRNGKRLLSRAELRDDVQFCVQRDVLSTVPEMSKHGQMISSAE